MDEDTFASFSEVRKSIAGVYHMISDGSSDAQPTGVCMWAHSIQGIESIVQFRERVEDD